MKPAPVNKMRTGKPVWAYWYGLAAWKKVRAKQLHKEPWCRMCAAEGVKRRATVADHIEPHRGDYARFLAGPFQSLCAHHHNSAKQRSERLGYDTAIGADGLPLDGQHPFYRG